MVGAKNRGRQRPGSSLTPWAPRRMPDLQGRISLEAGTGPGLTLASSGKRLRGRRGHDLRPSRSAGTEGHRHGARDRPDEPDARGEGRQRDSVRGPAGGDDRRRNVAGRCRTGLHPSTWHSGIALLFLQEHRRRRRGHDARVRERLGRAPRACEVRKCGYPLAGACASSVQGGSTRTSTARIASGRIMMITAGRRPSRVAKSSL